MKLNPISSVKSYKCRSPLELCKLFLEDPIANEECSVLRITNSTQKPCGSLKATRGDAVLKAEGRKGNSGRAEMIACSDESSKYSGRESLNASAKEKSKSSGCHGDASRTTDLVRPDADRVRSHKLTRQRNVKYTAHATLALSVCPRPLRSTVAFRLRASWSATWENLGCCITGCVAGRSSAMPV